MTEWKEKTEIRKYFLKLKVVLEIGPQRRLHFDGDSWGKRNYLRQRIARTKKGWIQYRIYVFPQKPIQLGMNK